MIFGCNITLGFKRCATVNFETFSKGPRNQDRKTGRDRRNRFRPPFGHSTKKVSHKNLDDLPAQNVKVTRYILALK